MTTETAASAAPLTFEAIATEHPELWLAVVMAERLAPAGHLIASRSTEKYLNDLQAAGCEALADLAKASIVRKAIARIAGSGM
ncbi:MAG TPA: hypothetical protein VHD36_12070 [Pirellulales bacterium]|nr:hypothetical protein [Pirellulales bacterium]